MTQVAYGGGHDSLTGSRQKTSAALFRQIQEVLRELLENSTGRSKNYFMYTITKGTSLYRMTPLSTKEYKDDDE